MGETVLMCADPLAPRRPDPAFAAEAAAVRELGGRVVLLDHEALLAGDADGAVARVPRGSGPLWYRGWMIPADRYAALAGALAGRGSPPATSAERYRAAHELPGWYDVFEEATPRSAWLTAAPGAVPGAAELARLAAAVGPGAAVVKDWVKSRKHEWAEACHVPDTADAARLAAVVRRFVELQGEFLTGGVVLRAFEYFTGEEARVWWLDGAPLLVTAHPDTPGACPEPELAHVAPLVRALGCRFVTTDVALRSDGVWRVVEVGDGQVSGLPEGQDPRPLAAGLLAAAG
ncbi:hypothetical protein GCM10027168_40820 [Streptomyces capparidis]